jgi:hypothetical protein
MSNPGVPLSAEGLKQEDRSSYFEQRLFAFSPFGTFWTTVFIFVLFAGLFFVAMAVDHKQAFAWTSSGLQVADQTRGAFPLSLLIAVALGLQRWSRVRDRQNIAASYTGRQEAYFNMSMGDAALWTATLFGIAFGVVLMFTVVPHPPLWTTTWFWFFVATVSVSVLASRGVALTRAGSGTWRHFIDTELQIDLLRIDQLSFIGRSAARTALIWFAVSAVVCLFFTSRGITLFTVALVAGSFALGVAIFVGTMERVHRRIRAAKSEELDRIRSRIEALRHEAHQSADSAQRLQGLIAYEGRIAAAPEWPFDQSTAMRVGASALILTVPWFGQAVAGTLVDHLGQFFH